MKKLFIALLIAAAPITLTSSASAADYTIDPVHSGVRFELSYANISPFWGQFREFSGDFTFDAKNISKSKVAFEVNAESVFTGTRKRDDHLRSPDFLSAKQFPKINFKSKSVKAGSKANTYVVTGDLTLRGVTKTITADLVKTGEGKDGQGNQRIGFDVTFTINRLDYGVSFMPDGLGKDVTMRVNVSAVKK